MRFMPLGMGAMFLSIVLLTVLFTMSYRGWSESARARFGALIGVFAVCAFMVHNYVNLNIRLRLTVQSAAAFLVEWIVTGIVMGLIYRPAAPR